MNGVLPKILLLWALLAVALTACPNGGTAAEVDTESKVKVGDTAPAFSATTTDDKQVSLAKYKGKVLLLNLFATWCPPCRKELPLVENEVWKKYKARGLQVLVLGREHSSAEIKAFKTAQKLTLPMGADPKREVFNSYAAKGIPRNYVIGKDGKVLFTSVGYNEQDFAKMKEVIERAL